MGETIKDGDLVVLYQLGGGKKYVLQVSKDSVHLTVGGYIRGRDVIGKPAGAIVKSSAGVNYVVLKAGIQEQLEFIKRKSQIIYPKDLSLIATLLDAKPCLKMIQSGVGTGYSIIFFARILGSCGHVLGVDVRDDMISVAKENLATLGYTNVEIIKGDIYSDDIEGEFDIALLDLPEPCKALKNILGNMKPGSRIAVFLPTISQVERMKNVMSRIQGYFWIGTYEVSVREWKVDPGKTRPSNMPSSHTGFITILARMA